MKNKKIVIPIIIASVIFVAALVYFFITKNSDTEFSISETLWIQKNKDAVINVSLPTNLPVFSQEGEGVFFDYIEEFEDEVGIDLNEVTEDSNSDYNFKYIIQDKEDLSNIVFHTDTYVALSPKELDNTTLGYIKIQKAGALASDTESLKYYLDGYNIKYYNTKEELISALNKKEISLIFAPQTLFLDKTVNNTLYIAHYFNDIEVNYILDANGEEELNSILLKTYNTWTKRKEDYYKNVFNLYVSENSIDEITKTNFKSKRYSYGYVEDMPYDKEEKFNLLGVNSQYINSFANTAGIEFSYIKYNTIEEMKTAFAEGKIDIMFANYTTSDLENAASVTSHVSSEYVILKHNENDECIDSLRGLKNQSVAVTKNTLLASELTDYSDLFEYNKTESTVKTAANNEYFVVLDKLTYEYYKNNYLKEYIIIYDGNLSESYNFIIKDSSENQTFKILFDNFIKNKNIEKININAVNNNKVEISEEDNELLKYIVYSVIILFLIVIALKVVLHILKDNKKKKVIQKDEKMRYFDMMTSLKNRNYLNQNMESWGENTIYPQTIIIVDLNKITYINDTHGQAAGDKVIVAAANILINTQLEHSDIIRTNGNEFLVYLVGYREKEVVGYIRKLYKEMKTLPYNYGAEIGYSTISDDIKTIDDAINEATLDMRKNKKESK